MEPLVEPTVTRWFPPDVVAKNPPYLDRARAMIRNTPVNGFIGCAAALADHDFRSGVAATKPPVLFIAGEKDAGGAVPAAMKRDCIRRCRARAMSSFPVPGTSPTWMTRPASRGRCSEFSR